MPDPVLCHFLWYLAKFYDLQEKLGTAIIMAAFLLCGCFEEDVVNEIDIIDPLSSLITMP